MDDTPRLKTVKKMYEDMTNAPARPSVAHTSKAMDMADKMFTPAKKAKGGYVKAADGCASRGKTRGRLV